MRLSCWILVHLINSALTLLLWAIMLAAVYVELTHEKPRPSYLSVEEAIFGTASAAFFVATRIAQGYWSLQLFLKQASGESSMDRSYQSQICTLLYAVSFAVFIYFCLRNHNNGAAVHSRELSSALHMLVICQLFSLSALLVEQFGHPSLVLFCVSESGDDVDYTAMQTVQETVE